MSLNSSELNPILKNITKLYDIGESFVEMVLQRLYSFGYIFHEDDSWIIEFCIQKVERHIKNSCNISCIPLGLKEIAVDRVCGEFLFSKKQTGKLDDIFDLEMAVKQVQTGDTTVVFAVDEGTETVETRLNQLISYLINVGEGDLICYRKMSW